jgi:Fe-S cluster biosynthesis and repair protein YggX
VAATGLKRRKIARTTAGAPSLSIFPFCDFLRLSENIMTRTVNCVVLGHEAEGLDYQPYPGELGERIFASVSKEGWQRWLKHQTMLINEYRLTPVDPKARKFLVVEMEKFFFGAGSEKPAEFKPE